MRIASLTPTSEPVAATLPAVLTELRRGIRRRVAARSGIIPLPVAQLELLRLVRDHNGLRVQEASGLLRIAPNTVSTLARQLEGAGLIDRWTDARDGRATRLRLTAAARKRLARWRDERPQVVSMALTALSPADRRAIEGAVLPLRRMVTALESDTGDPSGRDRRPDRPGGRGLRRLAG